MAERYWITGVQIGVIKGLLDETSDKRIEKMLDKIVAKQFIESYPSDKDKKLFEKWVKTAPTPLKELFERGVQTSD